MKVSIHNIGCRLNFAEVSYIQKQFENSGFTVVDFNEKADVVILNTCTVTNQADADSRKYIRRAIRNNPNAFVAVMGCYSQLNPNEVKKIQGVDLILGTNNKFEIINLIDNIKKKQVPEVFISDLNEAPFHFASSVDNESKTRVVFKIQDGCDYLCTYCTIPKARGKSRSMDFAELKSRLLEMNNSGYSEIVLSGINLGEYHSPTGEKFVDVLKFIANNKLNYRVRISSIEPNLVTDEIIKIVKNSENICNHFHLPLQSGSDDILKVMKRRYLTKKYLEKVEKIKSQIPDCCIGADVIEGFPLETNSHFEETYNFISNLPISYLHVFTYSQREGTPAAEIKNQIPVNIRKERTNRLRYLSKIKRTEFIDSQIGKVKKIIPETIQPKNGNIILKGLTDNYINTEIYTNKEYKGIIQAKIIDRKNENAVAVLV